MPVFRLDGSRRSTRTLYFWREWDEESRASIVKVSEDAAERRCDGPVHKAEIDEQRAVLIMSGASDYDEVLRIYESLDYQSRPADPQWLNYPGE